MFYLFKISIWRPFDIIMKMTSYLYSILKKSRSHCAYLVVISSQRKKTKNNRQYTYHQCGGKLFVLICKSFELLFTKEISKRHYLDGKNDKSLPPMSKVKFRNSWRFFEASTIFNNNFWHLVFWQTRFFTFFFKLEQVLLWGAIYPASMIDRKILASA